MRTQTPLEAVPNLMFGIALFGWLHFLSSIVGSKHRKGNKGAICVLNLFLGWTLIGRVIAMMWPNDVAKNRHSLGRAFAYRAEPGACRGSYSPGTDHQPYGNGIDGIATRLLALRQPLARDLRLLTVALKINADLERIGDVALAHSSMLPECLEPSTCQNPLLTLQQLQHWFNRCF
jgi:hypothetical protein